MANFVSSLSLSLPTSPFLATSSRFRTKLLSNPKMERFSLGREKRERGREVRSMGEEVKGREGKDVPEWAKPGSEEAPPWARGEEERGKKKGGGGGGGKGTEELPFGIYLVASSLVAIAAVGSIFEYFNQNPIFGLLYPDSPLWAPILGFFALTGFPTAGFLFYKAISGANRASREADEQDGFFD